MNAFKAVSPLCILRWVGCGTRHDLETGLLAMHERVWRAGSLAVAVCAVSAASVAFGKRFADLGLVLPI